MKPLYLCSLILLPWCTAAQTVNVSQRVVVEGVRANQGQGSFLAAASTRDGNLAVLYDQGDGVRIFKTDATGTVILNQTVTGAAGDSGTAMAVDTYGNVFVTGTTSSSFLRATTGAAFSTRSDTSINSFLAEYDANLNLVFLTFLGSGRTQSTGVAVTDDAVFVTGITFNAAFPVTSAGIQQTPALNSSENGFVERFTRDGSTLVYATYLTGANGNTIPTAIVVDVADNAYVTGSTSASGYPTIAALQPVILGSTSGFLSSLTPLGDGFVYSTFIAGNGLTSMAFDPSGDTLLLTGNISLGKFPVTTVSMPLVATDYQTLLRVPINGQAVASSVLLVPGLQSYVAAGPNGDAWIAGSLTIPIFPGAVPPNYQSGDSFLLHLKGDNAFDQTLRLGGTPVRDNSYANLTSTVGRPAITATGLTLPGTLHTAVTASLLAKQRFDFPLISTPSTGLLPNSIHDALPTNGTCTSQCAGSAAFLTTVNTTTPAPSLGLSTDDMPNLTLRNLGSALASGLVITTSGFSFVSNCGQTLLPSSQCHIALTGAGPGSISVSSSNTATTTAALGTNAISPDVIFLDTAELDFGITTSANPTTRTITVSNLSSVAQSFTSAVDGGARSSAAFSETASDCLPDNGTGGHILPANSSCHISLSLLVSNSTTSDGPVRAAWKVGPRDIVLTGFAQAAALNVSATEIDFGTHFATGTAVAGPNLPRYLYISNNSPVPIPHSAVGLTPSASFTVYDACPSVLLPQSVCQMKIAYAPAASPSQDASRLSLDNGLQVLLTGTTLPPTSVTGSSTNPALSVSTKNVDFNTAVIVSGTSAGSQSVLVRNIGASSFNLSVSTTGEFPLTSGCPPQLAGGASCTLLVTFSPSQPGTRLGLLSIVAGTNFAPTYVSLSGMAAPILPPNNGVLDLGQTLTGEPVVVWYKVQASLASLTVSSNNAAFGIALVADVGNGHGLLPASDFAPRVSSSCTNCWLGIQFLYQATGLQVGTLSLSVGTGGNVYALTLTGTALPVQGLLMTPVTQDFGTIRVNSAGPPITFTLTNLLSSDAAIQSVTTTGDFSVSTNRTGGASCVGTLVISASCFIEVTFSPLSSGQRGGTLDVITSVGSVHSNLVGYGSADAGLAISPTELDFRNAPGSSATQQAIVLSNTGVTPLSIGTVSVSDHSFAYASNCTTLAPGALCVLTVSFVPQVATVAAMLSIPVTTTINGQIKTTLYTVNLNGDYTVADAGLQVLPAEVNFGSATTGTLSAPRQFVLNNLSGKELSLTLQMPRQFPLTPGSACATLSPNSSCTFSVEFLPITGGPLTGTVYARGISTDGLTSVEALTYMLGYGVGKGILDINGLPIPFSPVNFGQVSSGQSTSHTLTLTNGSSEPLSIHRISSAPPFLSTNTCGLVLVGGASCTVTVIYSPINQIGGGSLVTAARSDSDSLIIESDAASSPDVVSLEALAMPVLTNNPSNSLTLATFDLSQSALTFANTQVGSSSVPQTLTVTNTGTTALHFSSIVASNDFSANTTCATLSVGSTCEITTSFVPTNVSSFATRSGTLQILSDAGTSLEFVSLIGTSSAAPLAFNPAPLDFGSINVGSSKTLSLSVTNTTAAPVTFLGYSVAGDFSVTNGSCPAVGSTLPAGSSCSLNVSFMPSAVGVRNSTLTLTTDATPLPLTMALSGTGVQLVPANPSFALTVNGGSTATLTVVSGSPAIYTLLLTPMNGFTGPVALTCTPVTAAVYASCSLLSSTLTLNGSALPSTATINTITTTAIRSGAGVALLMLAPVLFWRRRRSRLLAGIIAGAVSLVLFGCGSASRAPAGSNIQRTPPGMYQYQVTASSTTGNVVSSTVTLNMIVQ